MSSDRDQPASPPGGDDVDLVVADATFACDDDETDVPPAAELVSAGELSRGRQRPERSLVAIAGVSVLTHAAVVFAAITVYALGGRMPDVSVSAGTGAASAQGLVVTSEPTTADPIQLPGVDVAAEAIPEVPAETPATPLPLQVSAAAASGSARTESWPGPAPDISADVPGGVARLGLPPSPNSFATPDHSGNRPPARPPAASTDVAGTGDGVAAGPPAPASGNRPPRYPPDALRKRIEGTVLLKVEVRPTGETGAVDVARSSGHRSLDDAAVEAVRKWRFRPATDAAGAVVQTSSVVTLPVEFVIRAARG
jgi:TonB family protein